MRTKRSSTSMSELRNAAEAKVARTAQGKPAAVPAQELLHGFQVRQTELEMQNESLRQVQAALEASRDRYVDLFDFAPVGYLAIDEGGLIAELNLAAANLLGESRSKLTGRHFAQFIASNDRDRWRVFFSHSLQHAERQTCELMLHGKAGTPLRVRMDCQSSGGDGTAGTLRAALTDVSEHHRLAAALSEREHYQRALLDNFPFLVWLKDENSRYLAVNRPFSEWCGRSSIDQVIGKTDLELWSRDLAEAYQADDRAIMGSGKPRVIEELAEAGGKRVWVETYKSPVTVAGRVIGTVGFATDITGRKQALLELQSSEERLRLAKRAASLGIFDRDIPGGEYHLDESAREFCGVGPDEAVSFATFMAAVHPDDRADMQTALDQAVDPRGNGDYSAEYRVVNRSDGGVRTLAATGQVTFKDGQAVRILGTLKDISAQKKMELEVQERRSAMELLVRQQVAAHTAAAIAHELNQPLVSISAYSEAALRMLRGGSKNPEKLLRALEGAMEQAQRAGRTLHELLDFLHKGEASAEPIDLNKVVGEALAITMEGGYGEFRPLLELQSGLPLVRANRLQVQKVVVNLLHNSVEAMHQHATGTNAINIAVRSSADGTMAQVTVRDSGPGVDAVAAGRIFEPFFTTKAQGIGLGLAICRALIEAHGGRLWVDPQAGSGATFHFTLPFAP